MTSAAHIVNLDTAETLGVLGPTLQLLTPPEGDAPCVMRGTIPPGVAVPLHSHLEPETFFQVSGEIEALTDAGGEPRWLRVRAGEVFHVPPDARHAFRNRSDEPAVMLIATTSRIARFFREVATDSSPEHFLAVAERYRYWNATPAENAAVGLALPDAA
jgi:quercetin dioxygenase-like cupin family protein